MGTALGIFRQHSKPYQIKAALLALLPDNIFKEIHKNRLKRMKGCKNENRFTQFRQFLEGIEREYTVVEELKDGKGCIEWIILRKNKTNKTYYFSIGGVFHYVYLKLHASSHTPEEAVKMFPGRDIGMKNSKETLQETREACERIVENLLGTGIRDWLFAEMLKEFRNDYCPEKMWKFFSLDLFKKDVEFMVKEGEKDCHEFMNADKLTKILRAYNDGHHYELDFFSFTGYLRKYCEIYKDATEENRKLMDMKDWDPDTLVGRFKELERVCEEYGKPTVHRDPLIEKELGDVFADFYSANPTLRSPSYAAAHLWKHGFGSDFYEWKDLEMKKDAYFAIPGQLVSELKEKSNQQNLKKDYQYTFPLYSQYMTAYSRLRKVPASESLQMRSLIKPDGTWFIKTIIKGSIKEKWEIWNKRNARGA